MKHFNPPPRPNKNISEVISGHVTVLAREANLKLSNIVLVSRPYRVHESFDGLGKATGERLPETQRRKDAKRPSHRKPSPQVSAKHQSRRRPAGTIDRNLRGLQEGALNDSEGVFSKRPLFGSKRPFFGG